MTTTYQRRYVNSVDDIRAIADHAGSHFFSKDAMRWFDSRILEGVVPFASNGDDPRAAVHGARFAFVTSERNEWDGRKYSVRILTLGTVRDDRPYADIATVDSAYRLDSAAEARKAAYRIANGEMGS